MTLPLLVREMAPSELPMVLSNWKKELRHERHRRGWGRGLEERDFWCLVNHVIDRITLPSSSIFVGCHEDEPETPCCWAARRGEEILFLYARQSVGHDAELAATLERSLLSHPLLAGSERIRAFNPFLELRRRS